MSPWSSLLSSTISWCLKSLLTKAVPQTYFTGRHFKDLKCHLTRLNYTMDTPWFCWRESGNQRLCRPNDHLWLGQALTKFHCKILNCWCKYFLFCFDWQENVKWAWSYSLYTTPKDEVPDFNGRNSNFQGRPKASSIVLRWKLEGGSLSSHQRARQASSHL